MTRTPAQQLDDIRPPREVQGSIAARSAIVRATTLTCLVRDEGPCAVGAYLDDLTVEQMYALVTTLAAMVPDDRPVEELLGWIRAPKPVTVARPTTAAGEEAA